MTTKYYFQICVKTIKMLSSVTKLESYKSFLTLPNFVNKCDCFYKTRSVTNICISASVSFLALAFFSEATFKTDIDLATSKTVLFKLQAFLFLRFTKVRAIYLEPVWDCYLNSFFMILIASTRFQIPRILDN